MYYTILNGNTDQAFSLDTSTGVLSVLNSTALDYKTTPTFSLLVQVSDGSLSDSAFFNINLMESGNLPILSIEDIIQMVYPNPSIRVINIKMDQFKEARIYNLSGQILINSANKQIDVSALSGGVYLIKLENNKGQSYSVRFIKR